MEWETRLSGVILFLSVCECLRGIVYEGVVQRVLRRGKMVFVSRSRPVFFTFIQPYWGASGCALV